MVLSAQSLQEKTTWIYLSLVEFTLDTHKIIFLALVLFSITPLVVSVYIF